MYKQDLALNNLQGLICHKTPTNQQNYQTHSVVVIICDSGLPTIYMDSLCCVPVKGPEEIHEIRITWNKYIEQKYKYSIGKRVLFVSLTTKVLGWS